MALLTTKEDQTLGRPFRCNMSNAFFQAGDEERLKQLNDEQLLRLLEEAYHSKKLDDKNKSTLFKVSFPP